MEEDKYLLSQGTYVSFWNQARSYAIVRRVTNAGIVFQIYKVTGTAATPSRLEFNVGDTAFFSWHNVPNLKLEKAPPEDEVSYASWT
jgi:hypothetical protein